ncbi:FAD-dependent oxidoreductase [Hazenella sp. IB182353]|uniref:dihydrolipoyl dehydrogenase family protein n=1 Tax=Polycladospora coralii TaxID=2771432 RepID=UPI001747B7DF|nr:FAD-dependent oxidoreductase [Polycladospora coralii]MBS7529585.1 FAD-dependent oxidoreductase [Polycladospora coralii]
MKKYDLIVLGGGAGGLVAAAGAASFGAKVALIDPGPLGGDCLWTGCVPTKSFIHSSKLIYTAKSAGEFGLKTEGKPEFKEAKARLERAIQTIQKHDDPQRFIDMGIDYYDGRGSFAGKHEMIIDGSEKIYGKRIVIATGARPFIPPIQGLREAGYETNETILKRSQTPKSLLVIGGGPIGLEYAQAFARFGSQVTVVEMAPSILIHDDEDCIPPVMKTLKEEGIQIFTGAEIKEVSVTKEAKQVVMIHQGKEKKIAVTDILVATGRTPNIEALNLDSVGIQTERGVIVVNDRLQTTLKHVYAVGDVIGKFAFTHAAGEEGKLVVSNAVLGLRRKINYQHLPWVTYTDPQVFHLGMTEREARQKDTKIQVYKTTLAEADRFITEQAEAGLVKIITDKRGVILGAHAVGSDAGDWMQEIVFAKRYGHKIGDLSQVIHPYPARTGALQKTADLFWRDKLFSSKITKWIARYVRWFR